MDPGAFSIGLAVRDINIYKEFYYKLGFELFGGDKDQQWLILKNRDHLIVLFQDIFNSNLLILNPRWDLSVNKRETF